MRPLLPALLLLALAWLGFAPVTAAPARLAADATLAGLTGGLGVYPEDRTVLARIEPAVCLQALRLGIGAETSDGYGLTAGTMLAQVGLLELSLLPVTVRAFKDFDPTWTWRRRTAYVLATYHWNYRYGVGPEYYDGRYVELGCGFAWTLAAVTPKVEFRVRPRPTGGPNLSLMAGVDLGGAYAFGASR
jgi:hypothetical protein